MRKIWIATADRVVGLGPGQRGSGKIENLATTWEKLAARLAKFKVTDETFSEYMAADRNDQLRIKDVGSFVGGQFAGNRRRKDELIGRSVVSLDLDHLPAGFSVDDLGLAYHDCAYAIHSTHKHSPDTPRLRLVFPLSRDVTLLEYEPVARIIASWFDMELYDDTTFQPARVMFWPSRSSDGEEISETYEGNWIDPDAVLAELDDWQDPFTWPLSTRAKTPRLADTKVEYAPDKRGIVGAFCRAFDIHQAIAEFPLPYAATNIDERYTYTSGSSAEGAIVYDFDTQLFSHHESDPAYGGSRNAWDLTRIHLYGELDEALLGTDGAAAGELPGSPTSWPSHKALIAEVSDRYPAIVGDLQGGERPELVFDDLTDNAPDGVGGAEDERPVFDRFIDRINNCQDKEQLESTVNQLASFMDTLTRTQLGSLVGYLREQWIAVMGKSVAPAKADIASGIKQQRAALVGDQDGDEVVDMQQQLATYIMRAEFHDGGALLRRTGKKFWSFDKGLWAMDEDERIAGGVQRTLVALRKSDPEDNPKLHAMIGDKETTQVTNDMVTYMSRSLADQTERDDPLQLRRVFQYPIINCLNKTLVFDGGGKYDVQDHNPADFLTTRINVTYDPDAVCDLWDEFVQLAFSDAGQPKDMVRHLEEFGGYVLQLSRWIKLWVLCHGPTNTGKSTFQDLLTTMLGDAALARSLNDQAWKGTFAFQPLIGKLLITEDDMERSHTLDDGMLKRFSEDKLVTTEVKNGSSINFMSHAFFMINSNHWPRVRDITMAMRDRAVIIPFTFDFVAAGIADDSKRRQMLNKELPGILNRFVAGLQRLRKRGRFLEPETCISAKDTWLTRSNPVAAFCAERMETIDKGGIRATSIWIAYKRWYLNEYPGGGTLSRSDTLERIDHILGPRSKRQNQFMYPKWQLNLEPTEDLDEGDMTDE